MPYDPTPTGDDYFSSIQWDAKGPFQLTQSGKKSYIPPASAATAPADHPVGKRLVEWAASKGATYADPGGATPESGFASNRGTWDQDKGEFDGGNFFNTSLGALVLGGGVMAAPLAAGALAGAGGASGAGAGGVAAGIPATAGIGSATSLGLPVTAGLGTAGAAGAASAAAIPTTYGISSATSTGLPATSGLGSAGAAGGGIPSYLKTLKDVGTTASDISRGRAEGRVAEAGLVNNANNTDLSLYRAQIDSNNAQNRYGLDAAAQENDFATRTYGLDLDTANQANRFGLDKVNAGVNVGNLELNQRDYALAAPGKRASNSVRGDILANSQDVSFDLPSTIPKIGISGGLRPSMFSDNTRQLGRDMSAQALDQQRKGDAFGPLPSLPNYQGPTSKLPTYKAPAPYVNPPAPPRMAPQPQANGVDTALNIAGYAGLAAPYLKYLRY